MDARLAQAMNTAVNAKLSSVVGTPAEIALRTMQRSSRHAIATANRPAVRPRPKQQDSSAEKTTREYNRSLAQSYMGRPAYYGNHLQEELTWAVFGAYADHSGGGVLAWCYDELDAKDALRVLAATGDYFGLTAEEYASSGS